MEQKESENSLAERVSKCFVSTELHSTYSVERKLLGIRAFLMVSQKGSGYTS